MKKYIYLVLSLLASYPIFVLGDECEKALTYIIPEADAQQFQLLQKGLKELSHFSASDDDILNLNCRTFVPSDKFISDYLAGKSGGNLSQKINGVEFENESPEMIRVFHDLTTYIPGIVDTVLKIENQQIDIQHEYKINPRCKKVQCAVEKIFGKDIANKILFLKFKYELNASHLTHHNSEKPWEPELNLFIRAASVYPDFLMPLGKNVKMKRYKRGKLNPLLIALQGNGAAFTVANSSMEFFDMWGVDEGLSYFEMEYTAVHEIAHKIGDFLKLDDSQTWKEINAEGCHISKYAKSNDAEDFAESVASYRYSPTKLKKICPKKYDFIKETVFRGIEYLTEKKCKMNISYEKQLVKLSNKNKFEDVVKGSDSMARDLLYKCKNELVTHFSTFISPSKYYSCIKNEVKKLKAEALAEKLSPPLKYKELVKNFWDSDIPAASKWIQKINIDDKNIEKLMQQEEDTVLQLFAKDFYQMFQKKVSRAYSKDKGNSKKYCNLSTFEATNLTLSIPYLTKNEDKGVASGKTLLYIYDDVTSFTNKLCLNLNQKKNIQDITQEDILRELKKLSPFQGNG